MSLGFELDFCSEGRRRRAVCGPLSLGSSRKLWLLAGTGESTRGVALTFRSEASVEDMLLIKRSKDDDPLSRREGIGSRELFVNPLQRRVALFLSADAQFKH